MHQTGVIQWVVALEETEERGHHAWEDGRQPLELNPPSLLFSEDTMEEIEVWERVEEALGPVAVRIAWSSIFVLAPVNAV